jgi:hypothetical protein
MLIWYIFSGLGTMYQEKSGNPVHIGAKLGGTNSTITTFKSACVQNCHYGKLECFYKIKICVFKKLTRLFAESQVFSKLAL